MPKNVEIVRPVPHQHLAADIDTIKGLAPVLFDDEAGKALTEANYAGNLTHSIKTLVKDLAKVCFEPDAPDENKKDRILDDHRAERASGMGARPSESKAGVIRSCPVG